MERPPDSRVDARRDFLWKTAAAAAGAGVLSGSARADAAPKVGDDLHLALAATPRSLITGMVQIDQNGVIVGADVRWPDGTPGRYSVTEQESSLGGAVNAYTITYGTPTIRTYTQRPVNRNSAGHVIFRPPLIVS